MSQEWSAPRSIGVLICSYRRVPSLARCLTGLAAQQHPPDDVIIVVREGDEPTQRFLTQRPADRLKLRQVVVTSPGSVHALNAGLAACRTDVLAIADDDTVAHPDWLARIFEHFVRDPRLGALGGRDRCHDGQSFDESRRAPVGRISWYGRAVGNHHCGYGPARDVDYLKGANMSYRAAAFAGLRFDARLRGTGAQPYEDAAFSLAVGRAGWRVGYDPAVLVDHYAAATTLPRHYVGAHAVADVQGYRDFAFNNVVAYWDEFPAWRRMVFLIWSVVVGSRLLPGVVQAIRFTPALGAASWRRFLLAQQGKFLAVVALGFGHSSSNRAESRPGRAAAITRDGEPAAGGVSQ
jgi:GT2 family glycosyltransferase